MQTILRPAAVLSVIAMIHGIHLPAKAEETPIPTVLADGADAKSRRVEGMHKTRFIEIFLAHRDAKTGKLVAELLGNCFPGEGR
jgi:hypothetical protein